MNKIRVEVVYALAETQHSIELELPAEAAVSDALNRVGALPAFADVDLDQTPVGIFGAVVTDRNQRLNEGDRVEIYRPLTVDPMTARRLRASRRAD